LKKFLVIALSAVFVLGFAASAFAIHAEIPSETQAAVAMGTTQITLGGSVRVRGELRGDTKYDDANEDDDKAAWDQRVRLSLDAKVSDNVQGFVMLEAGSLELCSDSQMGAFPASDCEFGILEDNDVYTWGGGWPVFNPHQASGVYPFGNGKRGNVRILEAWINWNTDLASLKIGHMPLALGNNLFFDHRKFGDDALIVYKTIDNLHLAALTAKFGEYLTSDSDDQDAYVGLFAYKGEGFNASGDFTWVDDNLFELDLYNAGLRGDVNIGDMFNVYADGEFQFGSFEDDGPDFNGWAAQVGATAKLDPVTLGLEFGYGTGDAWDDTDTDVDSFVTSLSPGIPYITFVHGTRSANVAGFGNGITNLTYVKGSVSGNPTPNLSAKADIIWLQASEDYFNPVEGAGDDSIGFEIDGNAKYKLGSGLVYFVEGGYFFVDDAYAQAAGVAPGDEQDAWAIRHGIELTF
jgi:hypothetical protein